MITNLSVALGELFVKKKIACDLLDEGFLWILEKTIPHLMFLAKNDVQEYRVDDQSRFLLEEVLVLIFLAIAHDAETYSDIEVFGNIRISFLRMFGTFKNGIPSSDVIRRTLMMIEEYALKKMLFPYVATAFRRARKHYENRGLVERKLVNGSRRQAEVATSGLLNVYDSGSSFTIALATYNYKEKEATELTVARSLLSQLNLKNSICSLDALHFHRDIMKQITASKGHFVIGLKGNQPILFEAVKLYSGSIEKKIKEGSKGYYLEEQEKSHNQVETWEWFVFPSVSCLKEDDWGVIKTFVCLKKTSYDLTKEEYKEPEYHYCASSLNDKQYSSLLPVIIRNHWRVENNLCWNMDEDMSDEDIQLAHIKASHNFTMIKKYVLKFLGLLQKCINDGTSVRTMRKELGWATDRILTCLFSSLDDDELSYFLKNDGW